MNDRIDVSTVAGFWQCDNCGHTEDEEKEIFCWQCTGGKMLFKAYNNVIRDLNWRFERCKPPYGCGRNQRLAWSVPDSIWRLVAPPGADVLCLDCFDRMAESRRVSYSSSLVLHGAITWEDDEQERVL